jgi:hypothetical protein
MYPEQFERSQWFEDGRVVGPASDLSRFERETVRIEPNNHHFKATWGLSWNSVREDDEPSWWGRIMHRGRHHIGKAKGAKGQSTRRMKWFKTTFLRECLAYQRISANPIVTVGLLTIGVWLFVWPR